MEFINRSVYPGLKASLKEKYVTVLLGPRQTGKSTLLKKLMADLKDENIAPQDMLFINFDDPVLRGRISSRQEIFFQELEQNFGESLGRLSSKKYLFIDEAQKAPQVFDLIKIIYDKYGEKIKAVITGSSSLNLLKRSAETLVGRLRLYHLSSFSWGEIAAAMLKEEAPSFISQILKGSFSRKAYLKLQAPLFRRQNQISFYFNRYVLNGGLPEIFLIEEQAKRSEALNNYLKVYLEQEIRFLPQIGDESLFLETLQIFLLRDSQLLNQSKLASDLGAQRLTLKKYQTVLENTFLLTPLSPLTVKAKQAVKSQKIYFFDHGLVNFSKKIFSFDALRLSESYGHALENIIVNNALKLMANNPEAPSLNFWRDYAGHEIDLVISVPGGGPMPIEITASEQISRQKLNNFKTFYQAFPEADSGFIIYPGQFKTLALGHKTLYAIPFWMWL